MKSRRSQCLGVTPGTVKRRLSQYPQPHALLCGPGGNLRQPHTASPPALVATVQGWVWYVCGLHRVRGPRCTAAAKRRKRTLRYVSELRTPPCTLISRLLMSLYMLSVQSPASRDTAVCAIEQSPRKVRFLTNGSSSSNSNTHHAQIDIPGIIHMALVQVHLRGFSAPCQARDSQHRLEAVLARCAQLEAAPLSGASPAHHPASSGRVLSGHSLDCTEQQLCINRTRLWRVLLPPGKCRP